jgi:plastocyanin
MSRRIITALSCGALALGGAFVAGCGSDNKDSGSAPKTSVVPPATTGTTAGSTKGSFIEVSMKDNTFVPEKITAKVGQTIKWTNDDPYPHNVTATKGENFQSDNINGGGTYEYKLDKAGTINYVCTIHSGQRGQIRVTKG